MKSIITERLLLARKQMNAAHAVTMPGKAASLRAAAVEGYKVTIAITDDPGDRETIANELDAYKNMPTYDDVPALEMRAALKAVDVTAADMPPMLCHVCERGFIPATDDPDVDAKEIADIWAEDLKPRQIAAKPKEFQLKVGRGAND